MTNDPLYLDILAGLRGQRGQLDATKFEHCACALLQQFFHPTLVPIPGGNDGGMDGACADGAGPAYPLVCTTQDNVIGNLRGSLQSSLDRGHTRRQAIVATSQALTALRRKNLEEAAGL